MKLSWVLLVFLIINLSACKDDSEKNTSDFILIDRGGYFVDSFKDIGIYRLTEGREVMNGYYIIGNELAKWEEFSLVKGVLNGDYKTYHTTGNVASKGEYVNGKLHGTESTYYLSGELNSSVSYHKGIRHGKSSSFFESGQLKHESVFENNTLVESTSYDIIGNIKTQTFFKEGREITQTVKEGKVFSEQISSTYDDYEAMKYAQFFMSL